MNLETTEWFDNGREVLGRMMRCSGCAAIYLQSSEAAREASSTSVWEHNFIAMAQQTVSRQPNNDLRFFSFDALSDVDPRCHEFDLFMITSPCVSTSTPAIFHMSEKAEQRPQGTEEWPRSMCSEEQSSRSPPRIVGDVSLPQAGF